jgi:hypothetical protein
LWPPVLQRIHPTGSTELTLEKGAIQRNRASVVLFALILLFSFSMGQTITQSKAFGGRK